MKGEEKGLTEDLRASAVGGVGGAAWRFGKLEEGCVLEPKTEVDCGAGGSFRGWFYHIWL